jgi:hypothetical protein
MSTPELTTTTADLTIITVLREGRHLVYTTRLQPGDDPTRIATAHCLVRGHYNGDAVRFVIVSALGHVETVEARS